MEDLVKLFKKYYKEDFEKLQKDFRSVEAKDGYTEKIEKEGVFIREIKASNGSNINIIVKVDENKITVIVLRVFIPENSTVNVNVIGKSEGELYFYSEAIHEKKSISYLSERFIIAGKMVNLSKIIIPENSEYSEGNLEQIIINKEGSNVVTIPILDVRNNTSKGMHASKNVKLSEEEIFYLKHFGIQGDKIFNLIEESMFPELFAI
jgi:Fe-S cluster assembly scaffold protein SufB